MSSTDPRSYTPRHLSEEVLTSRGAVEGERKRITVLFCDIANSTALAERFGPEAMHELLDAFFERSLAEVHRFGGTVNQFLGDGFMALFGAPLAHEDHGRRAALAAWDLMEDLKQRPLRIPGASSAELRLRMGLNSGLVVVGKIGDALRMDYTAIGDTTNLAARLQSLAEPGTILVSDAVRRAAGDWVECVPLGNKAIKGKAEPVAVYLLAGVRKRSAPPDAPDARTETPLVGRDQEIASLLRAIGRVANGEGGVVLISGEAGIGKSRLVAEARRTVRDQRSRWLEGRALSFGETTSYWPFQEIIRSCARIGDDDTEDEAWGKVMALTGQLFPTGVIEVLPYLATLLGLRVRDAFEERVRYLDDRAVGAQVLLISRRFFAQLAASGPTVIVVEDLHWVDRSSAALLEHLLPLVRSVPLLIIVTSRADASALAQFREAARTRAHDRVTEVDLAPLPAAESNRLLERLLGGAQVSPSTSRSIVGRAGGNPLFLEEVVRSLGSSGTLDGSATALGRGGPVVAEVSIPDTVQGLVMARVDRLDEELKEILTIASVVGRSVLLRVLQAAAGDGREGLERSLGDLERAGFLRHDRREGEVEYEFNHALVQQAIYESVLGQRRRELHRRVGECIERLYPERLEEFYGLLAHHFAQAEEWARAQEYLFKAGDEAGRVAADAEALTHYQRALETYAMAFGDKWDPIERAVLERKIGDALFRLGRHDQAIDHLERSLEGLGHPYPGSDRRVRLAIGRELLRQAAYRVVPSVLRGRPDEAARASAEEAYASYRGLTWMHYFLDPQRFGLDVLLSLNLGERNQLPLAIARGSAGLGMGFDVLKRSRLAARYHARAIAMAEELDHPLALGESYLGWAVHEFVAGRLDPALLYFVKSHAAFRQVGDLRGWGVSRTLESWVLRLKGDFRASLDAGNDALRVALDANDTELKGWALEDLARTRCLTGDLDEAVAQCEEALEAFRSIPAPLGVSDSLADLGFCYLRQGRLDRALEAMEESSRLVSEAGLDGYNATQIRGYLAECYLRIAEESLGAGRSETLKKAKRGCRAAVRNSKAVPLGTATAYRLQGTYKWLMGHFAAAEKWWRRSLEAAEGIGMPYHVGLTELEMGRWLGDPGHLDRAIAIFDELGAPLDAAQAHEAKSV